MSRSTQFIGLTSKAQEYVLNMEKMEPDTECSGMFEEEIPLGKWKYPEFFNDRQAVVREIVQASPWSSGPMIFTCLEIDWDNGGKTECFQWITNPKLKETHQEFDEEAGEFWV